MVNLAKVRDLLNTMNHMATFLNDNEISEIGKILLAALQRVEKEQKEQGIDEFK